MSEQSFPFDFQRTPNFFSGFNNQFHLTDMSGSANNFEFVFASYSPSNIQECLNGNNLDTSVVTIATTINASLNWDNDNEIISVKNDVTWSVGQTYTTLQAVFLRDKTTKFVMGYSINPIPFDVTNEVKIKANTIVWSFIDGN